MIKVIVAFLLTISTIHSYCQPDKKQTEVPLIQISATTIYRLFPTQNMWNFIKLNTRNGQMWQVQFDIKGDDRLVTSLNSEPLVTKEKEVIDRFTLYATQNIYTFILLDQVEGKTWQVQWSVDAKNRVVIPIE